MLQVSGTVAEHCPEGCELALPETHGRSRAAPAGGGAPCIVVLTSASGSVGRPENDMRVGVNTSFLLPGKVGGSETYVRELLDAIGGRDDVELVVFTNRENDGSLRDLLKARDGVEFCSLGFSIRSKIMRILGEQVCLPGKVRRAGVDLLWSPGYTAPRSCAAPQVVTIHDMQYETCPEVASPVSRWMRSILVPMAARRSRRVLTVSEFARNEIVRYTGVPAEKIDVTPEAADEAFAVPVDQNGICAAKKRLLGHDAPYVLCVSNTYPHKRVDRLVTAFGRVKDRIPHVLVLVGFPGRGEPAVVKAIAALATRDRVVRLQSIGKRDLVVLYQGADLVVLPSVYEGFGLPVLEAMTAGAPVLTTRSAAIPEVGGQSVNYFDHARDGDLEEKMLEMLALDAGERDGIVAAARKRAESFSWDKTAAGTLECFRKAIQDA